MTILTAELVKFAQTSVRLPVLSTFTSENMPPEKVTKMLGTVDMFSWTSGLQYPLIQNNFNMFLEQWTSVLKDNSPLL